MYNIKKWYNIVNEEYDIVKIPMYVENIDDEGYCKIYITNQLNPVTRITSVMSFVNLLNKLEIKDYSSNIESNTTLQVDIDSEEAEKLLLYLKVYYG